MKDLDIFTGGNVKLENILIIDNNLYSFAFNLENGIPVQHYMGDNEDKCLLQVMKYLKYIKNFDNLAEQNEKIYDFRKIYNSNTYDFIDFYYSDEGSDQEQYDEEEDFSL